MGVLTHIQIIFATTFYTGKIPGAPGTYSSLLTCIPAYFLMKTGWLTQIAVFAGVTVVAFFFIRNLLRFYESSDPPELNIDEVSGQLITFIAVPFSWPALIAGFALFRFFDILKPFPVGRIDKNVKGASGILLDDIAAGLMANALLQIIFRLLPHFGINTLV